MLDASAIERYDLPDLEDNERAQEPNIRPSTRVRLNSVRIALYLSSHYSSPVY